MKKRMMILIAAAAAGSLLFLYTMRRQTTDGPFMENPDGWLLDEINGTWQSEDQIWQAEIDNWTMTLFCRQKQICHTGFTFHTAEKEQKTVLIPDQAQFESEDGSLSGTIKSISMEDKKLVLELTIRKEESLLSQRFMLERMNDTAELIELF